MELKDKILDFVSGCLTSEEHFVVDVEVSASKRPTITVILDGDKGISIDHCSKVSRELGAWLEENNLLESAYVLEVSSPGVDSPLRMPRQFLANMGRTLQVSLKDGQIHKGKLMDYGEQKLTLMPEKAKKAKAPEPQAIEVELENIKTAVVLVQF
jgi:ribosome maturation factor RimP